MISVQPALQKKETLQRNFKKYWPYYLMAMPGVVFLFAFRYLPLLGSVIAFQDYSVFRGILNSAWVGFKNFKELFGYYDFWRIFSNTLILGLLKLLIVFPFSVVLALMINEVRQPLLKKGIQTIVYIPYFLSWVIVGGMVYDIFSKGGMFNNLRGVLGMPMVLAMQKESWFRPIYVFSSIWKEAGWGTVVYMAAINGIDQALYEAAEIDGASRAQRLRYITAPLLMPTVITMFLLNIGSFLELGFEQVYNLVNPLTQSVGDIFDTYVYRVGIIQRRYSFTTAAGLFQSVIGFTLVTLFNKLANRYTDNGGLW